MNPKFLNHAAWAFSLLFWQLPASAAPAAPRDSRPVLLYSRYFNAAGETRYLPDGTFKPLLAKLGADFTVHAHTQALDQATLKGVKVLLIANPSDAAISNNPAPHHFSARDVAALTRFVEGGGGLIIMGNQENHNLEVEDTNKLLAKFGLGFTNLYTDAKLLKVPESTPVIGGLRWAYYTGNLVTVAANHPAHPRGLVLNDVNVKPLGGDRNQTGPLLAVAEPGRGRVVVVTDSGWVGDAVLDGRGIGPVVIKEHDNFEIFRRLTRWAAHLE